MDNIKNKSVLSLPIQFEKIEEVNNADDRFTKVKIWLMHLGLNENASIFEKDVVDEAIPSLEYIPIVGFIENNNSGEKDFSDHRSILTKDEKGLRRKYIGNAYGVIFANDKNNAHYEERVCDDGETRTFLCIEGVIWNMFEDSSDIINRDLIKSQSMELDEKSIDGYEDEEGIFHFTKFSFRAACILGNDANIQPAMINSTVEVMFTVKDFVKELQCELNDKYETFTKLIKENNQGGADNMSTMLQQFNDISIIVSQFEKMRDIWGDEVSRYTLVDIQDNEIICMDRQNNYDYYGFTFSMNGDKPEIDFACGNKKKVSYVNYEDGTVDNFNIGNFVNDIENSAFAKLTKAEEKIAESEKMVSDIQNEKSEIEANYTSVKADYDEIKPKYDEFVKAENEKIEKELDNAKELEFKKFESSLGDDEEFITLKEQKSSLSLEEIEGKCSILYTRKTLANNSQSNFTRNSSITVGVMDNDNDDNDGYIHSTRYGNIPIKH